jgi:hypothetical protein
VKISSRLWSDMQVSEARGTEMVANSMYLIAHCSVLCLWHSELWLEQQNLWLVCGDTNTII